LPCRRCFLLSSPTVPDRILVPEPGGHVLWWPHPRRFSFHHSFWYPSPSVDILDVLTPTVPDRFPAPSTWWPRQFPAPRSLALTSPTFYLLSPTDFSHQHLMATSSTFPPRLLASVPSGHVIDVSSCIHLAPVPGGHVLDVSSCIQFLVFSCCVHVLGILSPVPDRFIAPAPDAHVLDVSPSFIAVPGIPVAVLMSPMSILYCP